MRRESISADVPLSVPVRSARVALTARDGQALGAMCHAVGGAAVTTAVVIAASLSAPQPRYVDLARYLAGLGAAVYTFDYRGKERSLKQPLRAVRAALHEWGELDLEGALRAARERHPDARQVCIGHGVGGQLLGLCAAVEGLERAVFVGAGSDHWRHWRGAERLRRRAIAGLAPALTRTLGFYPGRLLGTGLDLPRDVAAEWARWSRDPNHVRDSGRGSLRHFTAFTGALLAYSFQDDALAPVSAVEALLAWFEGARISHRHVVPDEEGLEPIGHDGFFSPRLRDSLWRETAVFLGLLPGEDTRSDGASASRARDNP